MAGNSSSDGVLKWCFEVSLWLAIFNTYDVIGSEHHLVSIYLKTFLRSTDCAAQSMARKYLTNSVILLKYTSTYQEMM